MRLKSTDPRAERVLRKAEDSVADATLFVLAEGWMWWGLHLLIKHVSPIVLHACRGVKCVTSKESVLLVNYLENSLVALK